MKYFKRKSPRWAAIILSIIVILLAISVQAQEGGFTETFDDPALPGWETSSNVEVTEGVLQIESGGYAARWGEWGDLNLILRASLVGEGALAISYQVTEIAAYAIHISRDEVTLLKAGEPIAQAMMETIPPGEWFFVELISIGEYHEIHLNGEKLIFINDPDPIPFGGIMLSVLREAVGKFDDLMVDHLGGNPTPEETRSPKDPPPTQETKVTPPSAGLTWVRTGGPPGGIGYDIRYKFDDPNTWFVTDNFAGVHISTDRGLTWLPSNEGIPGQLGPTGDWRPIFSLTIDPHNPDIVWVGTDKTGHIYKSIDGGMTFTQKDAGVSQMTSEYDALSFRGFTVDPNTSDVVYAMGEIADTINGGSEVWSTAIGGVVYKTTDGGEHWELLWDGGIPSSLARYMWINPQDTNILYVSTGIFDRGAVNEGLETDPNPYGGLGILKTTDGGKTWRVLNEANGLNFLYNGSLFMHPEDPETLLASAGKVGTDQYDAYLKENDLKTPMGVYRSTDGGETWTQVLGDGGFDVVEICTSNPNIAYAGSGNVVYRSEDAGVTWTQAAGQGGNGWGPPGILAGTPIDLACDPNDANRIFSNNYLGGNFLSEDGGKTWANASDGYTGAQIASLTVDRNNPAQIYAAGRTGIWSSSDGGSTWAGLRYPPSDQKVWGGAWGSLVTDPSDPKHLLASEETIWESFDGGSSWEVRRLPVRTQGTTIVFDPSNPKIVFTGGASPNCLVNTEAPCPAGHGIFVSHDGGTSWDYANDSNVENLALIDLAIDPANPQVIYAGTERGLFKTSNRGAEWMLMDVLADEKRVSAVVIHPQDSQRLMIGVENHGLYNSGDGGETWTHIASGLQPNSAIRDILFDPSDPQTVYLSDLTSGVYRSTDGGLIWSQINNGLVTRSTTGLAISSDGGHLYAATNGGGVFRLDFNGQPPVSQRISSTPNQTSTEGETAKDQGEPISGDVLPPERPILRTEVLVGITIMLVIMIIGGIIILFQRSK